MNKWIVPALLTGGVALLLWLLLRSSGGSLGKALGIGVPIDPNAALATAACTAGVAYYGGAAAGLSGLPLCSAIGPALAPVVKGAVDLGVTTLDGAGDVVHSVLHGASGAAGAVIDIHTKAIGAVEDVVHDAYGAGKDIVHAGGTVVSDVYSGAKQVGKAAVNVVTAPARWLGSLF